jgi:hypothetical protein
MIGHRRSLLASGALIFSSLVSSAQPPSLEICTAAQNSLRPGDIPNGEVLLMTEALSSHPKWRVLAPNNDTPFGQTTHLIYLAYFFSAPYVQFYGAEGSESAGAISIKVSVMTAQSAARTASIELYRPAIERGANRCESRGLPAINNRSVGINEYMDYHGRRGNSSNIEDFHFRYPYGRTRCAYTDRPQAVADTFRFEGVERVASNTIATRLFGRFLGEAYATNGQSFSRLRTELHYYARSGTTPACVGFEIPVNSLGSGATIKIHDLSSNWYSERGSWLIHRQ